MKKKINLHFPLFQPGESAIEWAENIVPLTLTVIHYILDTYQTEKLALQSIFSLKKSATFIDATACRQFYEEATILLEITEAILDRIIHDSYQILIDGEISIRQRYGLGK